MFRPTKALIDLAALRHNYALAQAIAPRARNMVMVKGNAYGHGAVKVATALAPVAAAFGVASIDEAFELRRNDIRQPILLLEGTFHQQEVALAAQMNFWLLVENQAQVNAILQSQNLAAQVRVWLGLDTGMRRLGFPTQGKAIQSAYEALSNSPNVHSGLVLQSHFACADNLEDPMTVAQLQTFYNALPTNSTNLNHPISLANSAGILGWPQSHGDWNRPGYMLYGNSPFAHHHAAAALLKPVMCFESRVISSRTVLAGQTVGYDRHWTADRDSTIVTVTVGYGDGYPRQAPNGTPVLIHGVRCPLVGRVSMDMISVDVTELVETVEIGARVVLWGKELLVNEIAQWCGTNGYELTTRMPARVPRVSVDS